MFRKFGDKERNNENWKRRAEEQATRKLGI